MNPLTYGCVIANIGTPEPANRSATQVNLATTLRQHYHLRPGGAAGNVIQFVGRRNPAYVRKLDQDSGSQKGQETT